MRSPCSLGRVPTSVTTSSASYARPPVIIEDLHTIADLRDPDQIRRDSDAGATRWPRDQPWITRTMHRTVRVWLRAPAMRASRQWGPCFLRMAGGTGVRGDAATYPSTEDACRRPRSRSKRPSCSTGGCGTTCCTKDTGPLRATQPVRPPPCRRPAAYACVRSSLPQGLPWAASNTPTRTLNSFGNMAFHLFCFTPLRSA